MIASAENSLAGDSPATERRRSGRSSRGAKAGGPGRAGAPAAPEILVRPRHRCDRNPGGGPNRVSPTRAATPGSVAAAGQVNVARRTPVVRTATTVHATAAATRRSSGLRNPPRRRRPCREAAAAAAVAATAAARARADAAADAAAATPEVAARHRSVLEAFPPIFPAGRDVPDPRNGWQPWGRVTEGHGRLGATNTTEGSRTKLLSIRGGNDGVRDPSEFDGRGGVEIAPVPGRRYHTRRFDRPRLGFP